MEFDPAIRKWTGSGGLPDGPQELRNRPLNSRMTERPQGKMRMWLDNLRERFSTVKCTYLSLCQIIFRSKSTCDLVSLHICIKSHDKVS
jgi:hypothetical protein